MADATVLFVALLASLMALFLAVPALGATTIQVHALVKENFESARRPSVAFVRRGPLAMVPARQASDG